MKTEKLDRGFNQRQLFCDWHVPNFLEELKFDYDEYFRFLKKTGAKTLIFMAKTAAGNCLFPSKIGFTNKAMQGDIFGEVAKRAKAAGLQFIAYYNMVLNDELAPVHPEWRQVDKDLKPLKLFLYEVFCMSRDGFREYVNSHMAEIAEKYPIDGFFLDLQYFAPEGCFCSACQEKFQPAYGYPLEIKNFTDTRRWLDFYRFQAKIRTEFILSARSRCEKIRPGMLWSWNGSGNSGFTVPELDKHPDFLSTEAHPPEYLRTLHNSTYCGSTGKPFVLFMPEGQGSWGDWTLNTAETMQGLSGLAMAYGGALNIDAVPMPCGDYAGKIPAPVWKTIAETFKWVGKREKYCAGKRNVPVAACLHSNANILLGKALNKAGSHLSEWNTTNAELALLQILSESHIPLDYLPDEENLDRLEEFELVILPELFCVSRKTADCIRAYVRGGGKIIASYQTSLIDADGQYLKNFELADVFGCDFVKTSPFSVSYLDKLAPQFYRSVPNMPLLLKAPSASLNPADHVLYCRARPGARVLGYITDPAIESDFPRGYHIYHDHSPAGRITKYPGIVANRFGRGTSVFLPVPFFEAYRTSRSPFLKEVFRTIVGDVLGVSGKIKVPAPKSVKTIFRQDDTGWLLHLIHIQKETDSMYLDTFTRQDPVSVRVKPGWKTKRVYDCLTGKTIPHRQKDAWTEFVVSSVTDHSIIRIERT